MSNKGKRYLTCPECKRKRYCTTTNLGHRMASRKCSKGHEWGFKIGIPSEIMALEIERIAPKLKSIFERDDAFYHLMRKR